MGKIDFETKGGVKVEIRDYLPRRWAKKQRNIILAGQTVGDVQLNSAAADGKKTTDLSDADTSKILITATLDGQEVVVEGMVMSVNGVATNIAAALDNLPEKDYDEIAEKCLELRGQEAAPLEPKNVK